VAKKFVLVVEQLHILELDVLMWVMLN
jgi:hypothetical protein